VIHPAFRRRRIDRLAQLLDGTGGRRRQDRQPALDAELSDYVTLAQGMTSRGRAPIGAEPRPEFAEALRAELIVTAQRDGIGTTAKTPDRSAGTVLRSRTAHARATLNSRRTRGAILIGLAAGTLALSGMSAASGGANPGDPLYSVKRSTESARLALAGSDQSRGELLLGFAHNRVSEARSVQGDSRLLAGVLNDMDDETRQGSRLLLQATLANRHDPTALNAIDNFVTTQGTALRTLDGSPRIGQSVALVNSLAERAEAVRADLNCIAAAPATDDLGVVPTGCHLKSIGSSSNSGRSSQPWHSSTNSGSGSGTGSISRPPAKTPASPPASPSGSPAPSPYTDSSLRTANGSAGSSNADQVDASPSTGNGSEAVGGFTG
jgi:hypothetical protein